MLKQRDSLTYREAVRLRHLVPVSREHRERADGRVSGQVVRPREGKPSGIDSGLCILEAPILDSTHGGNLGMELGRQRSERDWHVEAEIERGGGGNACWRMNRSCSKAGRARAGRCGVESSAFLPAQGLLYEVVRARASEQADAQEWTRAHYWQEYKRFVMLHHSARSLRLRGGFGDLASSWTRSRTRLVCSSLTYDREVRAWTRASLSCHQR